MPITKAVVSEHICPLPSPTALAERGYLPTTEWTCDECGTVYILTEGGAASVYWSRVPTEPEEPVAE